LIEELTTSTISIKKRLRETLALMEQFRGFEKQLKSPSLFVRSFIGGFVGDFSPTVKAANTLGEFENALLQKEAEQRVALDEWRTHFKRYYTVAHAYATNLLKEIKAKHPDAVDE
jgi:hypothetical protein